MSRKLGFIGCGNMGKAIMGGIISAGLVRPEDITASDVFQAGLEKAKEELGIRITQDNKEVVRNSDIVFFSIKPNVLFAVLDEIKPVCREDQLFISHVAGHPISAMEARLPEKAHLIRIMPNTPALVNAGMTGVSLNAYVTEEESRMAMELFDAFGKAEIVPEKLMDVVTGCSGSGPAYVFLFIEAMADAAVLDGMPRTQAYTFAAQTVLGSAKMVLETGRHPGELKDMVCSPGGTTIEAVAELEAAGLRNAVIKAEHACTEKSKALGK